MTKLLLDATVRMQRAKERLYVLCQVGGWGVFIVVQMAFGYATWDGKKNLWVSQARFVMMILVGLLLSHYSRRWIKRWEWRNLGWSALIPRVTGMSLLLSLVWLVIGFGYIYGVLRTPWLGKFSVPIGITSGLLNGMFLFGFWFCIYFIYHAFDRVQRMQVEQLRLATNVKEAELRALKSQVNPHFLFNSLNSLRALIEEDAPRAREAVTRLANILRYSLQSGQLQTVPLAQEIAVVKDYLTLEQIRHESRLQVRWDIVDEIRVETVAVPPMLLQTLVENAVKYGIGARREGGELLISAVMEKAVLRIRVTNPGELNPSSASAGGGSTGVGLRNASERLALLYGDRATLSLLAQPTGCVTAEVVIPLNPLSP